MLLQLEGEWEMLSEGLQQEDVERVLPLIKMIEADTAVENLAEIVKEFEQLQSEWKHHLSAEDLMNRLYRKIEALQFADNENNGIKKGRADLFVDLMNKHNWEPVKELWEKVNKVEAEFKGAVPETNINMLEDDFKKIQKYVTVDIGVGYRNIVKREFEKRFRLFYNRLERSIKVDFSTWLKSARKEKKLTLEELGKLAGISASYVHLIEKNSRKAPSIPIAEKLAIVLGYDPKVILSMLGQEGAVMGLREDDKYETPGLVELLTVNQYKLNDRVANRETKAAIKKIVSQIVTEQWSEDDLWTVGADLFKDIIKLQRKINS